MADQDIQSYLADKKKTLGASSVSKGGVTLSDSSFPAQGDQRHLTANHTPGNK